MATSYVARKAEPALVRENRVSRFADHKPSGKSYDDFLNRLRWQSSRLFESLREVAAIVVYKLKGYETTAEDALVKLPYDLHYVQHHTLALDLSILLRTLLRSLRS